MLQAARTGSGRGCRLTSASDESAQFNCLRVNAPASDSRASSVQVSLAIRNPDRQCRKWLERMIPSTRYHVGRLEILCSAAALCLGVGGFFDFWPFSLPIALVLLALGYWALRDLRTLNRLKHPLTAHHRARNAHAEQADRASR
jgi:hypothetical protein